MKTSFCIMDYMTENFLDKKISINNGKPFILEKIGVTTTFGENLVFQDNNGNKYQISCNDTISIID